MPVTDRQSTKPAGLISFLAFHQRCGGDFLTVQDRGAVTILCRGCEASFSYLTNGSGATAREVSTALAQLAGTSAESRPRPVPPAPSGDDEMRAKRLSPPGPWAPRRQGRIAALWKTVQPALANRIRPVAAPLLRRRKPIAVAALVLACAGAFLALSGGGQTSSSQVAPPLNGSDVPLTPGTQEGTPRAPVAGTAGTVQVPRVSKDAPKEPGRKTQPPD